MTVREKPGVSARKDAFKEILKDVHLQEKRTAEARKQDTLASNQPSVDEFKSFAARAVSEGGLMVGSLSLVSDLNEVDDSMVKQTEIHLLDRHPSPSW